MTGSELTWPFDRRGLDATLDVDDLRDDDRDDVLLAAMPFVVDINGATFFKCSIR